jgi:hypothetical protein
VANLKLEIDVKELTKEFGDIKKQVEKDIVQGVKVLASMTHAKLREEARDNLGSLAKKYQDAIEFINPEENLWIVNLKEEAMWIEEGRVSGFMEGLLNGKSSKTSKDGSRYAVIPFEHSKKPSEQSDKAKSLSEDIKTFLKQNKINYKKIEYGADGSPRLGLLHRLDIPSARSKGQLTVESKDPLLKGVAIYQNKKKDGSIRRDVMTFRIISEKHRGEGKWIHPGLEAKNLMDKVYEWALRTFDTDILPSILNQYK